MTMLSKQRILMDRVDFPDGATSTDLVIFAADDEGPQRSASLCSGDYADLGSPDQITVTIEPGDHLQDPS